MSDPITLIDSFGNRARAQYERPLVQGWPATVRLLQPVPPSPVEGLNTVASKDDFPAPQGGVIYLGTGQWLITTHVDLQGARLEFTGDAILRGTSSETASLTSTGLPAGQALLTSTHDLPIQDIQITSPPGTKALNLVAGSADKALDWRAVNFVDCAEVGLVSGYSNFVMESSALLNSTGMRFEGTIGTIAFSTCLFSLSGGVGITVPASLVVSRRFRIIYSSFVVPGGATGIDFSVSASVANEGYILDTVNFSGGGTYLAGVPHTDNKSRFEGCRGISNSAAVGHMTMVGNVTPTDIVTQGVAVKVAGTTVVQAVTQQFTHTNGRLTYAGARTRPFRVTVTASITAPANNVLGLYVAKNNSVVTNSENYMTANAGGRAENAQAQTVLFLSAGDYVEAWVENDSSASDVTVSQLSMIVQPAD